MADHSLRGYLKRRTTEELDSLLAYYLQETNHENYEHTILEILHVLKERYVPERTSEAALRVKELLLRHKPKD